MPFEFNPEVVPQRRRTKTLGFSVALHLFVLLLFIANPNWFDWTSRVVRVEGEDYDLKRDATMLTLPPAFPAPLRNAAPVPEPTAPPETELPPLPPALAPLPTPPPPTPTPPPMPPMVIRPNDLITEGARPEAPPRASRGNTPEPARPGSLTPPPPLPQPAAPPAAPPEPVTPPPAPAPRNETPPALASNSGSPSRGALPPQIAQNTNSSALRLPTLGGRTAGAVDNAIQNAVNNRPRSTASGNGRTGNSQGLELPNFSAEEPQILSDTHGYDFGPYLNQVVNRVRVNWYSLIPESVRYNGQRGRVVLTFTIVKSGSVQDLTLRLDSGAEPLDRAAMGSITASNPFQRLPSNFDGDHLTLQFTFLYNILPQ